MWQAAADLPADGEADGPRTEYVTAFGRGLTVIRCFAGAVAPLTISDVARLSGLSRATVRRFVHTLEADGYLRCEGARYALRPTILELGYAYLSSVPIDDIVHQLLSELAARLRESCSAGVLDGRDVVFIARARTPHPRVMTLALSIGSRLPAHLSAIGRVLLADLPHEELDGLLEGLDLQQSTSSTVADLAALREELHRVREQGYSIVDQEIDAGVLAAAVPVRRAHHPTIGISVALHATRGSAETLRTGCVPLLRETADEIERVLTLRH